MTWIPVTERLPKSGKTVVLWDERHPETGTSTGCYSKGGYNGGSWYEYDDEGSHSVSVTHWHPLPKPPKNEDAA